MIKGDQHYDIVSAFIKSMRGSDADAALHYLARMLEGGEDLRFIARRIVICTRYDQLFLSVFRQYCDLDVLGIP